MVDADDLLTDINTDLEELRRLQAEEESRFSVIGGAARQGSRVTGLTEQ